MQREVFVSALDGHKEKSSLWDVVCSILFNSNGYFHEKVVLTKTYVADNKVTDVERHHED